MKASFAISALFAFVAVDARPFPVTLIHRREVPQEHSHEQFITTVRTSLATNNPLNIKDPVFALLGNAAAAAGAGSVTDTDCLQQATADQAFTNAKTAADIPGMTAALIFRTLERNSGSVGLASAACTSITAANPEIAALKQHQDPASPGAAATNKAIVLELAKQIAAVGGNPLDALKGGTFAPGTIGDPTAKGNTCDTTDDPVGCIFTQNLLVDDATADEITAAVAGVIATSTGSSSSSSSSSASSAPPGIASASNSTCAAPPPPAAAPAPVAASPPLPPPSSANTTSASTSSTTTTSTSSTLDLGTCSNPTIIFGAGFDGRTESSFEPANKTDFQHGSADKIAVVASFICQQLADKCKASAATVTKCTAGSKAAEAAGVVGQGAADAFNAAFS
ncbi:hypothetical protein MMC25_003800 [Agyrium rufum]|nr:hypothetical protein [Agyrium rufum]